MYPAYIESFSDCKSIKLAPLILVMDFINWTHFFKKDKQMNKGSVNRLTA
jgi:hypothetical protein